MAILNLSDDALLVRHPAEAPRLTSRVTGHAVHLSEDQVVVVTLLGDGPLEDWELVSRARRYHDLQLDPAMLEHFVAELERLGLLWREEQTSEELPQGLSAAPLPQSGVQQRLTGPQTFNDEDALLGEPAPWLDSVDEVASDGTEVVAMDGILGAFGAPAEPTAPVYLPAADWESDVTANGRDAAQELAAQDAAARAAALLAPATPGQPVPAQAPPAQAPPQAQALTEEPTASLHPPSRPDQLLPNLQATPGTESATRPDLPGPESGPASGGLPDGAHPFPRLVKRWMPTLRPKSKSVLLTDPATGARRELKVWEYQLARMMDGFRSPEELVDTARTVGLILHLDEIQTISARLVREEILAPGTTPAPQPFNPAVLPQGGVGPGHHAETDASRELQGLARPFRDLGDSPDSIVDSLLSVPGRRRKSRSKPNTTGPVQLPAQPLQQARQTDLEVSLKMLAAFEQEQRHAEAEVALQHLLDNNPHMVHALATMERLQGTEPSAAVPGRSSSLAPWIAAGAAVLLLIGLLIASLVITIETKIALPCQTTMIPRKAVSSSVGGKVTEVLVKRGDVVRKRQPLVRVLDAAKKSRLNELRPLIADKQELLRIMRTTGTVDDERKQKRIVARLSAQLKRSSRGCTSTRCRRRIDKLKAGIASAKAKLKFCEWQAEPDEISRVAKEIATLETTLTRLAADPLEGVARSSAAGLITAVKATKGATLEAGAELITLADAGRIRVTAWQTGKDTPPPLLDGPASVRLVGEGSVTSYKPTPVKSKPGGPLVFEVRTDVLKVPRGAACQLELTGEPVSLLGSMFQ